MTSIYEAIFADERVALRKVDVYAEKIARVPGVAWASRPLVRGHPARALAGAGRSRHSGRDAHVTGFSRPSSGSANTFHFYVAHPSRSGPRQTPACRIRTELRMHHPRIDPSPPRSACRGGEGSLSTQSTLTQPCLPAIRACKLSGERIFCDRLPKWRMQWVNPR